MTPSVVILAFNSAGSLEKTLDAAFAVSDDVHVVDSFSSDDTVAVARSRGALVVQHSFETYGAQRNWAIQNLPLKYSWQLHLDADEIPGAELLAEIRSLPDDVAEDGFFLRRYVVFMGRTLRHGGMSPTIHMRLFRSGAAFCEERLYDQHFVLKSKKATALKGAMLDNVATSLSEWTARHNRWSDLEVKEVQLRETSARVEAKAFGNPIEKRRLLRKIYNRAPLFFRPFGLFIYRFFIRLGFLDGRRGFIFWVLQTFWFRFLVDAKLFESTLGPAPVGNTLSERGLVQGKPEGLGT